ncbi:MAG: acyltransferase [Bacteroidota bacterium]
MRKLNYNPDHRIWGLDLLRALAIIFVILAHGKHFIYPVISQNYGYNLRFGGYMGVELFFVLSGYLIGTILIKTFQKEGGVTFAAIKKFWVRRWFRTLPNYYLIIVVNVVVYAFLLDNDVWQEVTLWKYFVFLQNVSQHPGEFFSESWSLTIEEWFYLTIPLVMMGIYYLFTFLSVKGRILLSILLYIGISFTLRWFVAQDPSVDWRLELRMVMPLRLDSIGVGVLAAFIHIYSPVWWDKNKKWLFVLGTTVFLFNCYYYLNEVLPNALGNTTLFDRTIYFNITNLSFAAVLPMASTWKRQNSWLGKFVTITSLISYSLYLVHVSVVRNLVMEYLDWSGRVNGILVWLLFVVASYGLSYLLFVYFEQPMMKLRDKFSKKEKTVTITS